MSKARPSRGFQRFELRGGAPSFEGWQGVVSEGDPGKIPMNALFKGKDVRYRQGGEWWVRPGLVEIGDTFHNGAACIHNMMSYRCDPLRLWIIIFGCFGAGSPKGGTIYLLDPDQQPLIQAYTQFRADTDRQVVVAPFDGRLFFGEGSNFRLVTLLTPPYTLSIDQISDTFDTSVFSYPGFRISAMQEFDGKMFIALDGGAGASKIAVYDGLSASDGVTVPFDITGIDPVTRFCVWRNKLVAGFAAASGHIRVRDAGAAPGTWTTVAAAGVAAFPGPSMVSFKDNLYLANGAQDIFSYDGTTLASFRNLPNAATVLAGGGVTCLAVFNNDLYYGWNDTTNTHAKLGRFDKNSVGSGIEFQDTWKDFTAQNTAGNRLDMLSIVRGLTSYRDILFASFCNGGGFTFGSSVPIAMASSRGVDTAGLWDAYTQDSGLLGGSSFPIIDLVVY